MDDARIPAWWDVDEILDAWEYEAITADPVEDELIAAGDKGGELVFEYVEALWIYLADRPGLFALVIVVLLVLGYAAERIAARLGL